MKSGEFQPLAVTAMGMTTAVGWSATMSCAAVRAGISRATEKRELTIEDPEDIATHPFACSASPITDGFLQTGRWIQLARKALDDLYSQLTLKPGIDVNSYWKGTALVVVVPEIDSDRYGWPLDKVPEIVQEYFVSRLLHLIDNAPRWVPGSIHYGHAGTVSALLQAAMLLRSNDIDRIIVLAVDSYVDPLCLLNLVDTARLKAPMDPVGMTPGEAAACIMVEKCPVTLDICPNFLGRIISVSATKTVPTNNVSIGPDAFSARERGKHLAEATTHALREAGISAPFVGDLVLDLNGESWKAETWAAAQGMLLDHIAFDQCRTIFPYSSFGEIGAASGTAGLCVSLHNFSRQCTSSKHVAVLSISESGDAGAQIVTFP